MKKLSLRGFSFLGTALVLASGLISAFSTSKASDKKMVLAGSVTVNAGDFTDCTVSDATILSPCFTSLDDTGEDNHDTTSRG